ncbi:hypothetical protein PCASD_18158 [Puccinia coronata f. sp. avenae]|uniref:DNA 3'-5' helicase n=1 Tax=Puccinia coronata f. sp. avenae TaxID=200324 RepID=A0A2N5S995_9BASI|nr:hypothetical protein PCASD_18158 [Puccinia coronata f. sp. avenae]
MKYSPHPHVLPEEYPPSDSSSSSRSASDDFNEGLDNGSLDRLLDNHHRHRRYPSYQETSPLGRNDQQISTPSDRSYSPVPQARSTPLFNPSSSTEFQDEHDNIPAYPEDAAADPTYQDNFRHPSGSHQEHSSSQAFPNLIPISVMHEAYRNFFGFSHFNSVQSECFPIVYKTNHNVLTSAPTGSGKTVIFELAILRILERNPLHKAVYMAPTKSLCAERFRDWSGRFSSLDIKCVELTGDSENASLADAKLANIIITTPEKWDSMTRRWYEFTGLLAKMRLVCIDEVHMLNEERGSVLEVIVARMKTLGTNIRMIALSATVPNISDVAEWLGDGGVADQTEKAPTGQAPAKTFIFGEEYRPVKLSKFVYGYTRHPEHSEYQFMSLLNYKLMDHIISHSSGRPTLVFCGTRKSSLQAAEALSKAYQKMLEKGEKLPWEAPKNIGAFDDKKLTELGSQGIGIHHAGLDQSDRRQIEKLFISSKISVLCTTSTLSVGVNLPARCVIIRGTKTYRGGTTSRDGFEDYSELDLIQMMGRAGRPQFDDEGVAVVMTSQRDKMRIEKLVKSETTLESCTEQLWVQTLTEHINSEIYMGTIISRRSSLDWLENSFLSVRIKKNPKHYSISDDQVAPEKQLEKLSETALDVLVKDGLIEEDKDHVIRPTDLGEILSKSCLRHKTFLNLTQMKSNATMRNILEIVSGADEYSTLRFRSGEAVAYKVLNSHPEMKCPIIGKVTQTWHKVMLLIQAVLCGIPLADVKVENANPVMERIHKKGLVSLAIARHEPAIKYCLEFLRSVAAKAWDDSPWVLRQLDQIGEKSVKRLVDSGISTIDQLQNTSNHRIELILDRNPPFGTRIVRQACSMPKFFCKMETISEAVVREGVHVCVEITVGLTDTGEPPVWRWKNYIMMATVLVMTNDQEWIEFRTIQVKLLRETKKFSVEYILVKPSQMIVTQVACNQLAGIGSSARWKPRTPREHYPTPKTITEGEAATLEVLEGLNTKDLAMSNTDSDRECELPDRKSKTKAKSNTQLPLPVRKPEMVIHRSNPSTSTDTNAKKRATGEAGERMENGRYKCAHRCKGSCHHVCCRDGVVKPPKIREPPSTSSANSTSSQYSASKNSLPLNPIRTTNITRTPEDWRKIQQAVPGSSSQVNKPQPLGRLKPIRKVPNRPRFDQHNDLPSLKELEETSSESKKESRSQHEDEVKGNSSMAACSLQIRPFNGSHLPEKSELQTQKEKEPVGIEKFRNLKTTIEDFDERGIFRQRKEPNARPQVKVPAGPERTELAPKNSESLSLSPEITVQALSPEITVRSLSPEITIQRAEDMHNDAEMPPVSRDEDEVDELDEDWDIKIFEGYLAPGAKEAEESGSKRHVDQLDRKPSGPSPKRVKAVQMEDWDKTQEPSRESEKYTAGAESSRYWTGAHNQKDARETADRRLSETCLPTDDRKDRVEPEREADIDELDSDDSVDPMDEFLAWAESHVIKE